MYQIDKSGNRVFVGYISNLPREAEREVQEKSDRGESVVAEISHQERFTSGKFRHPGWIRLRPDKPLKSVTMMPGKRSGMPKIKREISSSSEFQKSIDAHLGRSGGRIQNPRRSKVKEALAAEAIRFSSFDEFARAYWDACARGIYWYPTDEKRFQIEEHERRLIESGRFNIYCSPELALKNKSKKYVAELDVTRLPADSIRMKRSSDGSEIKIVSAPGSVKVTRVLDADAATRSFQWQLSILPSSKEGLRLVWEKAWDRRRKESEKRSIKLKKEKEREERRAEAKREREQAYALRQAQRKLAAAKEVKAERAEKGRQAREEAQRRERAEKESAAASKRVQREREKLEKIKAKSAREKARLEKIKKAEKEKARIKKEKAQADKTEQKKTRTEKVDRPKSPKKKGTWKRVPTPTTAVPSPNPSKIRRVPKNVNRLGKQKG